ncbi:MAG: regulatory protein GemA [Treponema sp.]|nr:regulatory protein GemA [Treponema sp.]
MNETQKKRIKMIHVAKTLTHVSEDDYRAILLGVGVSSSKEITTHAQYSAVMKAFRALGFKYERPEPKDLRNPDWISARQEYYIRGLWKLASRNKTEQSLRALCKKITGGDDISFCRKKDAAALIQALRDIAKKAGFNPDRKED